MFIATLYLANLLAPHINFMFIATLYLANLLARVGDCTIFIYRLYWTQYSRNIYKF